MPLKRHENRLLKQTYLDQRYPIDQYAQRPRTLTYFVEDWNRRSGRSDSSDDVRHYMLHERKCGRWVRFDGDYEPLRSPCRHDLTAKEWAALEAEYLEIGEGRDQYASNPDLRARLAAGFFARTGHAIAADLLYAAAMAMQKHWENGWPTLRKKLGFRDIGEVA